MAGALRSAVSATDVILLMCASNHVLEHVPGAAPDPSRRCLAIIFDRLLPEARTLCRTRRPHEGHRCGTASTATEV